MGYAGSVKDEINESDIDQDKLTQLEIEALLRALGNSVISKFNVVDLEPLSNAIKKLNKQHNIIKSSRVGDIK